jgi:hypothetical protein
MPYPAKATLEILAQRLAATRAKVPAGNQQEFRDRIIELVLDLRKRARPSTEKPSQGLIEVAKKARELDEQFTSLDEHDRKLVDEVKRTQGVVFAAGEINDVAVTITNIAMLLHNALGKSYPVRHLVPRHLDVGHFTVKDQRLRELVFGLLSAASDTGGHFTFNKNSLSGSLATALTQLRPHLPAGLVPDPLPATTIQRLKAEFERLRKF